MDRDSDLGFHRLVNSRTGLFARRMTVVVWGTDRIAVRRFHFLQSTGAALILQIKTGSGI